MSPLRQLVTELHALRRNFTHGALARSAALLRAIRGARCTSSNDLEQLHDELLFRIAFPASPKLHRLAQSLLTAIADRAQALSGNHWRALGDSGIAGTEVATTIPWDFACWLRRHDQNVEFVIPDERTARKLDPLVRLMMFPAEIDAFDGGQYSSRDWLRMASRGAGSVFRWLVPAGDQRDTSARRMLFEEAGVTVRWALGNSGFSVSRNRVSMRESVFRGGFRSLPHDTAAFLAKPLPGIRRLSADEARAWSDASAAALGARAREVTPTMDPNLEEIYLADLGEGTALCVIGAHPERRLALESNYGFVMFANGVPIGYGGVTPLADQANTGMNLFPAFRRSEAAFLYAQALRAFHTLFGVSRFLVNPYQFGKDNDEAIDAGAFWFYDRLGFLPVEPAVRDLADLERTRLRTPGATPSTRATLRRLAKCDMLLEVKPSTVALFPEAYLEALGANVARAFSGTPASERMALVTSGRASAPGARAEAVLAGRRLLGPLLRLIAPIVARWPAKDRKALEVLLAAKGAVQERRFAQLSRRHVRFWTALAKAALRRPKRAGSAPGHAHS